MSKRKKKFISFFGGIGAGKTTAMELVAKELGFLRLKEQHRKNNFLPLFYKDMRRWALSSQLFFLCEKYSQVLKIKEMLKRTSVILDVDIAQDLCYLEAQKELGNIDKNEYALCYKIYEHMKPNLPKPDLMVYLKSSPATLKKHINERRRSYEKNISDSYLRALIKAQDQWVRKNKNSLPIITVDVEKMNFAHKAGDKEKFISLIKKHL